MNKQRYPHITEVTPGYITKPQSIAFTTTLQIPGFSWQCHLKMTYALIRHFPPEMPYGFVRFCFLFFILPLPRFPNDNVWPPRLTVPEFWPVTGHGKKLIVFRPRATPRVGAWGAPNTPKSQGHFWKKMGMPQGLQALSSSYTCKPRYTWYANIKVSFHRHEWTPGMSIVIQVHVW